ENPDNVGHVTLERMAKLEPYNRWLVSRFSRSLGRRILEIGAGFGNITRHLLESDTDRPPAELVVASDLDPVAVEYLRGAFHDEPRARVASYAFPLSPQALEELRALRIDSIVCCNVLEHIERDEPTLADMLSILAPGGRLALLVPAMHRLFGTLDEQLRHFRRYEKEELAAKLRAAGFQIEDLRFLNRPGVFGWWLNGRVLRRRVLPRGQLRAFGLVLPFLRREEQNPPSYGMSLLAIARKP
ncbi:MAG TPA: class I SAM-dependent methyltransferase, partial [Thermoanaerobaculia bacterium]